MGYDYTDVFFSTHLTADLGGTSGNTVIEVDTVTAALADQVRAGARLPLRIERGQSKERVLVVGVNDEAAGRLDVERGVGPYGVQAHPQDSRVDHALPAAAAQETVAAPRGRSTLSAAIQVLRAAIDKLDTREQVKEVTRSGGGGKQFTFTHDLGAVPAVAQVLPETSDAKGEFWLASKSATDVTIEYKNSPNTGTNNLVWNLYLHL
jgi:hypothetical protein